MSNIPAGEIEGRAALLLLAQGLFLGGLSKPIIEINLFSDPPFYHLFLFNIFFIGCYLTTRGWLTPSMGPVPLSAWMACSAESRVLYLNE